jgi:AcrR family transcriptional regulator
MPREKHAAQTIIDQQGDAFATKTRRRGDSLEVAILEAAWDELAAVGYTHVTMERVAERAKTSKAVVYRRWHNRAELIIAAMRQHMGEQEIELPDTGSLRGDLLALLNRGVRSLEAIGAETIHGLMAEYFIKIMPTLFTPGSQAVIGTMSILLKRAAERGEVDLDKVTPRIATLPIDLIRHEVLSTHAPVSEEVIVEVVDTIFLPLVQKGVPRAV